MVQKQVVDYFYLSQNWHNLCDESLEEKLNLFGENGFTNNSEVFISGDEVKKNIPTIPEVEVEASRYMFRISDHGNMGVGEDGLEPSGGKNAERTDIAKSLARYNLLFTQSLNISIPLNTNMKAGDIIVCKFPRMGDGKSKEKDGNLSGKYLIRALRHHIEANVNATYLKLIRDSYGFSEPKIAT